MKKSSLALLPLAILAVSSAHAIVYNGPLVVDDTYVKNNGTVITGNYQGTTTQPAISVKTTTPITIINSNLTGPGDLVYGVNADITVTKTIGIGTNPNVLNTQKGMFVHVENGINLRVENCNMSGVRFGVYMNRYVGNYSYNQTVKILNNMVTNIDGRPSDGKGGYVTTGSFNAHAFQLNAVRAVPGMEIAWNEIKNAPYQSQVNDNINIFASSGTDCSHLSIHDNFIQGAYPVRPGTDDYSGGGIITDGTAKDTVATAAAFIDIFQNQMVSSSNHGVAIAAGHDVNVYNNRVVSSGYLADGTFSTVKNAVGMYNWNCYNQPTTVFYNNHVHDNLIGLVSKNSTTGLAMRNDWWFPGQNNNAENNTNWQPNNATNPKIADENNEYNLWVTKKDTAHKIIGT